MNLPVPSTLPAAMKYWIGFAVLNQQTTVFVSSHILDDIERVCDQIAILHRGKLVKVGEA